MLSSPIIAGDLGRRSGRFPKSSLPVSERGPRLSPHDLEPHGNFKAEVENGPPDEELAYAMFLDPSLIFKNRAILPVPPPALDFAVPQDGEASQTLAEIVPLPHCKIVPLPHFIRGPDGKKAYIEYREPSVTCPTDNAGMDYPKELPSYAKVLSDREGIFYHPYCKRYSFLMAWRALDEPWSE
jgi:hypothetical protein